MNWSPFGSWFTQWTDKTKPKQTNSTITITTDWIKHSKYKDWYHLTDLDASICRNDSGVVVLASTNVIVLTHV